MKKSNIIAFDKARVLARTSKSYLIRLEMTGESVQVSKASFHMFVVYPLNLVDECGFLLPGRTVDVVITEQNRIYPNRAEYQDNKDNPNNLY